jgi:uncharacterized coiled-coil DUF342 family protein
MIRAIIWLAMLTFSVFIPENLHAQDNLDHVRSMARDLDAKFKAAKEKISRFESDSKAYIGASGGIVEKEGKIASDFDGIIKGFREVIEASSPTGTLALYTGQLIEAINERIARNKRNGGRATDIKELQENIRSLESSIANTLTLNGEMAKTLANIVAKEQLLRDALRREVTAGDLARMLEEINGILRSITDDGQKLLNAVTNGV